jgi:hypothetical protein
MITRDAPIDTIPLYHRSGGIIAMLDPSVETLAPHSAAGVVGLADVQGIYDVRAVIDAATATGRTALTDGTELDVAMGSGAVALPANVTAAADETALSTCDACGLVEPMAGATRVRISVAGANDAVLSAGALTLHHHAVGPLRVRWDVVAVQ